MRKVIFLDRDGTLIKEKNFIVRPREVEIIPSALSGLRLLKKAGYGLVIFSNQSGIARGLFTEKDLRLINQHIRKLFKKSSIVFAGIYYCPHHPEGVIKRYRKVCGCRKPKAGMLVQARRDFGIDLKKSFVIGDSLRDLEAGKKVKARTILVLTGKGRQALEALKKSNLPIADYIAPNLLSAAKWIIAMGAQRIPRQK